MEAEAEATTSVQESAEVHFGEVLSQADTHKVDTLVTDMKVTVHQDLVAQEVTFTDIEDQTV